MTRTHYREYRTVAGASRYMRVLEAKWPHKIFSVRCSPRDPFHYAVAVFCEPDTWAFCS